MGTLLCLGIQRPNSLHGAVAVCSKLLTQRGRGYAHSHVRVIKALAAYNGFSKLLKIRHA